MRSAGHRLPETPIARTGRGGIHILVRAHAHDEGHVLRLGDVRTGELKAKGDFMVACPSRTEGPYTWLRSPEEVAVAAAPHWLGSLIVEPPPARRRRRHRSARPGRSRSRRASTASWPARPKWSATEVERDRLLFWASCRVAEHGPHLDAASEIPLAAAVRAGLLEREARTTIASGLRR